MVRPSVSLVIPTYNRKKLLGELLVSATNQSTQYDAIIVVDDGSSDSTEQYLSEYYSDITYIKTPNRGTQHARNIGIQAAQTEWVTLCDSDDLLDVGYNENINNIITTDPSIDLIYSNFQFFGSKVVQQKDTFAKLPDYFFSGANIYENHISKVQDLLEKVLVNQFLWPSGMTVRKSAIDNIGAFNTDMRYVRSEDLEFTLRAISKLNIALSRKPLVKIRKHGANQSADSVSQIMGEITILQKFMDTTHFGFFKRFVIEQSIAKRSEQLLAALYDRKRFNEAILLFESKKFMCWSIKAQLKYAIAKLSYPRIQNRLWELSKKIS